MEANRRSQIGIFLTKEGFPYLIGIVFRFFTIPLKKFFVNDIYWYENMYLVKIFFLYKLIWRASIKDILSPLHFTSAPDHGRKITAIANELFSVSNCFIRNLNRNITLDTFLIGKYIISNLREICH